MTKKKIVTLVISIVVISLVAVGAVKFKSYYDNRYVASGIYYAQVPADISYEDSWLYDNKGEKVEQGYAYVLVAYNENGEQREVHFSKAGNPDELYAPGTYLEIKTSSTIVLGQSVVDESKVPQKALEKIKAYA